MQAATYVDSSDQVFKELGQGFELAFFCQLLADNGNELRHVSSSVRLIEVPISSFGSMPERQVTRRTL